MLEHYTHSYSIAKRRDNERVNNLYVVYTYMSEAMMMRR